MDKKCEEAFREYRDGPSPPITRRSERCIEPYQAFERGWTAALELVRGTRAGRWAHKWRGQQIALSAEETVEIDDLLYPPPPVPLCACGAPATVVVRDDLESAEHVLIVRPLSHAPLFDKTYEPICGGCLKARVVRLAQEAAGKEG